MMRAIEAIRRAKRIVSIGHAIQTYAEGHRFSVVRDFCGHGVGRIFHDAPSILHFGSPNEGTVMREGMIFTVEPMINAGRWEVKILSDGWTAVTKDRPLSAAQPRGDLKPLAKKLIDRFHGFAGVLAADRQALLAVPGMGDAAVAALMAVREAGLRLARTELRERPVLGSWQKVIDYCTAHIGFATVEEFHLLFLDRKNALITDERQQRGTVDHTPVYPREVVKRAIELGASALIMAQDQRDRARASRIKRLAVA